ncbi:hypothetical protein AB0L49_12605 [Streptomyces antimycoticus]|uniref:hypothetical protein n=1 Tax=Streptomyces antimycoticus TaxID=68175 RepID=UPI003431057E
MRFIDLSCSPLYRHWDRHRPTTTENNDAATAWVPDAAQGTLTADLGRAVRLAKVSPEWTRTRPVSPEVRTSLDGRHWREGTTGPARFVRVTVRSADDRKRAGIEELRVTRAK